MALLPAGVCWLSNTGRPRLKFATIIPYDPRLARLAGQFVYRYRYSHPYLTVMLPVMPSQSWSAQVSP